MIKVDIRTLYTDLLVWKKKVDPKPLILRGARQVGKSTICKKLGSEFDSFLEINFEGQPDLFSIFDKHMSDPKKIAHELQLKTGVRLVAGKSLLFLDEIQECPSALKSLRYFREKMPQQHVIAAGSLLEFALKLISFPVGRIEFMHMFPFSFSEFLCADGRTDLAKVINDIDEVKNISTSTHSVLIEKLEWYLAIGGMPEVVSTFFAERNVSEVQTVLQGLVATYRQDFNKYGTKAQVPYLKLLFDNAPRTIGKKFKFSEISSEARARELRPALELLCEAGLIHKCNHSSGNGIPLSSEVKSDRFKLFFIDSGLAFRALGLNLQQIAADRSHLLVNRGEIAEQFVAQELLCLTRRNEQPGLFYWQRDEKQAQAEVDFLCSGSEDFAGQVIPVEVKAGHSKRARSLAEFMGEKKSKLGIVFTRNHGVRKKDGRLELPLYAVAALKNF